MPAPTERPPNGSPAPTASATAPGEGAQQAGKRAAGNTAWRAAGEITGKVASLILFAVLARTLGESGLGVYVLGFAFVQLAAMPIELGFDRYFIRRIVEERFRSNELYTVLALKLALAVPIFVTAFVVVNLLDYGPAVRHTVYVLTPGLLLDSLSRTLYSFYFAFERSVVPGVGVAVRGIIAAALGLAALAAGFGVVTVAAMYTVGAGAAFVLGLARLQTVGRPPLRLQPRVWREFVARSVPFAAQDAFSVVLARIDTVILSLLAVEAAVGRYGAAYRLLEATFFLSWSINTAFAAMYTYLDRDTDPSVQGVFQRSVKLGLALLVPCAVTMGVLAEPLTALLFGSELQSAAPDLRLLAPVVILAGLLYLSSSLIVSRRKATIMVGVTAGMVAVNIGLNLLLIPRYADQGAAAAMLVTELIAVPIALGIAVRTVGGVRWAPMLVGPAGAGTAMAMVMLALIAYPLVAVALGLAVYFAILVVLERIVAPGDLEFVRATLLGRLQTRFAR